MIDYTTGKLIRKGTEYRITNIDLNNHNLPRNWEYQKPTNEIKPSFLTGKSKKGSYHHDQKEITLFRKINLHPQPDSRRTLITEYAPINIIKPLNKKSSLTCFSSEFNCLFVCLLLIVKEYSTDTI